MQRRSFFGALLALPAALVSATPARGTTVQQSIVIHAPSADPAQLDRIRHEVRAMRRRYGGVRMDCSDFASRFQG